MSVADMPPPKPQTVQPAATPERSVERNVSGSGWRPARNGDASPTHEDVSRLSEKVRQAIREDADRAIEGGERVLEGLTPPDGAEIKLRSDSKVVRRLRALRDGKSR